ncbi:MAG TPA: DNA polymerase III subunit beta [Thermodesulfobacteriaceae bacterium]|nr:DNA polymerase III subunit beta [Thermodesulfobacteriaceae bacterium]
MINFSVNKHEILAPLATVQTIVDKKTIMTIINNVFLYSDEDHLFIEATDLEISYKTKIPCKIFEQGAVTVNAKKLYEIIKEFPFDTINIQEGSNSWITIGTGKKAEYKIAGLPPDDFPRFRQVVMDRYIEIDGFIFKELIDKTIFSVSSDERKYSLSGIFFEEYSNEEGQTVIRMVSSDGHRLTIMERPVENSGLNLDSGVIISRKGASEIRKVIEGADKVIFGIDGNFCFLESGENKLIIRLVDGKFPQYKAIIPEEVDRYILFDRKEVYNALKRISILSSDSTFRGVKALVDTNSMEIESLFKDIGEAREIIGIEYDGEPFEMAFNAKYLMDVLKVMKSPKVKMIANNPESPCLIEGEEDAGFLGLIMPMNLVRPE